MIRVVCWYPFDNGRHLVGDYDNSEEAYQVADQHNARRTNPTDDVMYLYDSSGQFLREPAGDVGVLP
jgi:hypothetical protein